MKEKFSDKAEGVLLAGCILVGVTIIAWNMGQDIVEMTDYTQSIETHNYGKYNSLKPSP
tara:strand:+ start:638 stop:814 length:177 start_codon:yes stop_codon:yes gene_type:complete